MLPKLRLMALILCPLFIASPALTAPQTESTLLTEAPRPQGAIIYRDIAVIWLHVVRHGKTSKLPFTPVELAQMPVITVNGYVTGVVLLSKAPLHVQVNHRPMNPIRPDADGYFKLKNFGHLNRKEFFSAALERGQGQETEKTIRGIYSSFSNVPGDALSVAPEFPVTIKQNGVSCRLKIRQHPPAKLEVDRWIDTSRPYPDIYYLGDNIEGFKSPADEFKQRIGSFVAGIRTIEKLLGVRIVRRIHILDCDGPFNAYTYDGENQIWLYNKLFWNETAAELKAIAEHEVMHILSDRMGLPKNSRMRELFADLMNFSPLSRERFCVLTTGRPPLHISSKHGKSKESILFDFINESNFIPGMNGGHSKDNLDEFCASFLHTLIYADRLKHMLQQPVTSEKGSLLILSHKEKQKLLGDYTRTLKIILAESSGPWAAQIRPLIEKCLAAAHQPDGYPPASPPDV